MPKNSIPRVPSLADLKTVRNAVVEATDLFRRAKENLTPVREKARVEAERSADGLAQFTGPNFNRRAMVKDHVTKATQAFVAERQEKLDRAQRDISGSRQIVEAGRGLYTNKRALLDMFTLSNPQRAAYVQNLSSAGPAALINAASFALANRDAALAAAVAAVIDAKPAKERPLTVAELVADLDYEEINTAMALFTEVDRLTVIGQVEAVGVLNPEGDHDRITLGLEMRRVGLVVEEEGTTVGLDAATAKISRGLAARRAAGKPTASEEESANAAA